MEWKVEAAKPDAVVSHLTFPRKRGKECPDLLAILVNLLAKRAKMWYNIKH